MKRKKKSKLLCFFLSVVILLLSFPFSAFAAALPTFTDIDDSSVTDDLKRLGIDLDDYRKNVFSNHGRLLTFLEYGYDYYGSTDDYGLYVYFWNPSGAQVNTSGKNFIQMSTGASLNYSKYALELVDFSEEEGYEYVFYKFKVKNAKSLAVLQSRSKRTYKLSGIEIQHDGEENATDYKIAGSYEFTGYIPYHGSSQSAVNTLAVIVTDLITIDLDLHAASWKSKTSDLGAGHQYEVSSVYFSVPNDIIRDYGDPEDVTKGLVEVRGVYNEQGINGFVSSNSIAYQAACDVIGKIPSKDNLDFTFSGSANDGYNIDYFDSFVYNWPWQYSAQGSSGTGRNINALCSAIQLSEGEFEGISQKEFLYHLQKNWQEKGYFYGPVDSGRKQGLQEYVIKVDDGDLALQIQTYASSHSRLVSWIEGNLILYDGQESYSGLDPISVVNCDKTWENEDIVEKYFVEESDASDLKGYTISASQNDKTTYLLRFAVTDYFLSECVAYYDDNNSRLLIEDRLGGSHYYFEKTIFKDFDILELTYENQYSKRMVLPVVCSPIDVVGSVMPPPGTNTNPQPEVSKIIILIAIILGIVLLLVLYYFFKPWFDKFFRWIGKLFSWIGKQVRRFISWISKKVKTLKRKFSNFKKKNFKKKKGKK